MPDVQNPCPAGASPAPEDDRAAASVALVIVGATGDLTRRLLLPGLARALTVHDLPEVTLVGSAHSDGHSLEEWRGVIEEAVGETDLDADARAGLVERAAWRTADASDPEDLGALLVAAREAAGEEAVVVLYLALDPDLAAEACAALVVACGSSGLPDAVAEVYQSNEDSVLIEQFLSGREFCIAVCGPVAFQGGRLVRNTRPLTFAAVERVLTSDEQIFTSMDHRPITASRLKAVDPFVDALVLGDLRRLAYETYLELNLGSLIRLDVRSDDCGKLHVLEANPKPDLKKPADGVTSLVAAGLPELGMQYDDLILSLLADRLDFLFTHRKNAVQHLLDLLETRTLFDVMDTTADVMDATANLNVLALNAAMHAAKGSNEFDAQESVDKKSAKA